MALASSPKWVTFISDVHYRVKQSQKNKICCTLRPNDGLLEHLKLSSASNQIENRWVKSHYVRCSIIQANAESSLSTNACLRPCFSDAEDSSLCLRDSQEDDLSELVNRTEKDTSTGAILNGSSSKVNRRRTMLVSLAAFGVSCSCCKATLAEEWSYGGPSETSKWSGTCSIGARQSPIDLPIKKAQSVEALEELVIDYKMSTPTFKNPGHGTMEVHFPEGLNKLWINEREFNLVQFHFHAPSEHSFDGTRFPMEAHLVHYDPVTKAYAVVGVMLDVAPNAKSNTAFAAALKYSPLEHGKSLTEPTLQISANDLLSPMEMKNDRRYIHYMGSFTTPPCSESVDWFLFKNPLRVPATDILEFMKFAGDKQTLALNARPVQPLGDRGIFEGLYTLKNQ